MKLALNNKLIESYKANGKNPNYSLSFLLNSVVPRACAKGVALIETFKLEGAAIDYEIDDKNIRGIQQLFGKCIYFVIGADRTAGHHQPDFDADEAALEIGFEMFKGLIQKINGC